MAQATTTSPTREETVLTRLWGWIRRIPPIFPVLIVIFLAVGYLNPNFLTTPGALAFLRRAAPLAILAIGQLFVIASGGLDLSVGSLVTFVVIGSALLIDNDPNKAMPAILIMLGIGVLVGLINGIAVAYFKIPSLIATLGMLLMLKGAGLYWTGGAPRGYLTDNFRFFGRGFIENFPLVERFPVPVLILLAVGIAAYVIFHMTNLGRSILAVGDNPTASRLSGIHVRKVRIIAFILSSVFAIIAGIMVGGFGGVTIIAGDGLELQAISAAVLGGAVLLGGRGSVPNVIAGALTLEALFNLLNLLGLPKPLRDAVQGLIIIGAVAYTALAARRRK
ncbi:MAG TPA: ABC transporter permease [Anaerolineaceae bacterium]|nr:ABC transporter permease [Anaerolineaceae bacterium]